MDISTKKQKERLIKKHSPKSKTLKNCTLAALVGGFICLVGEALLILFSHFFGEETGRTLVSLSLILLAAVLTALGVFDKIARHAGAGTLVPITGFSNATVSEAIDASSEGLVLGVGAKIFTVSGPVILFGTLGGAVYGLVYFLSLKIAEFL